MGVRLAQSLYDCKIAHKGERKCTTLRCWHTFTHKPDIGQCNHACGALSRGAERFQCYRATKVQSCCVLGFMLGTIVLRHRDRANCISVVKNGQCQNLRLISPSLGF
ncbi:hypothetical protein HAX54_049596 [Datura stramonium]|uniref:Uncharacterized protein n=1 Tax=Datura stramonium TaxID=4076 RepID=A0ABS8WN51_DATST|nr:hypothetical protein [Datura stramonium]